MSARASLPARAYLFAYNLSMCLGWGAVLYQTASGGGDPLTSFTRARSALRVFQTGALLEVVHAAAGLVRAPVSTTAVQVASRLLLVWGVLESVPAVRAHGAVVSMLCAWALTELPRYAYFAAAAARTPPYWLAWLRYSTFLPLYPVGASSEALLLAASLPHVLASRVHYVDLPNALNFAFDTHKAYSVALLAYAPGLPHMYAHMLRQRRKTLARLRAPLKAE